jgi:putative hydrolase of the HAD superfamily
MFLIKNIVFDMGGVLIDFNFNKTLCEFFPEKYHDTINELVFKNEVWKKMDGGFERSEDVIKRVIPQLPEEVREEISSLISDFYPFMPPLEGMAELIDRLKKAGYSIYLLSNATPRFFDRYLDVPALTLMDGYFISALYKLLKPQREIYEAFCKKFSLKAEECFFIDDLPQNIQGAKDYGMSGFVFEKDIPALEKALNAAGVDF